LPGGSSSFLSMTEIQHRAGLKHQNADALSRKDGDQPLCEHQMKGENDPECELCLTMSQDWSEFNGKVDTVGNLGTGSSAESI